MCVHIYIHVHTCMYVCMYVRMCVCNINTHIKIDVHISNPFSRMELHALSLGLKMAQNPYILWSLGPKALKYASLEP